MSVGIMDADMSKYVLVPFNLECMKLSTYYKKNREIVVLSPDFTPERNTKFIYRKDWDDGVYPPNLLTSPNVEFGGRAFSGDVYQPLPLDIERCKPDTSLYSRMKGVITGRGTRMSEKVFKHMTEGEHIRLSLDGRQVWNEYGKQLDQIHTTHYIMFHDYDLNAIDGGFDAVQDLLKITRKDQYAPRIGMKWPVQCNNADSLMKWSSLRPNEIFYSIAYNGIMDEDTFTRWVGACYEKTIYNQIEYNICRVPYHQNDFLKNDLLRIFRQVIISRSYRAFFTLKYEDKFFENKEWLKVLDLMNFYQHSMQDLKETAYLQKIGNDTMYDFVKHSISGETNWKYNRFMSIDEIRKTFAFVRDHHPALFDAFYNLNFNTLEGGKI